MYIVPKNVNTRFEFFDGFGWRELFWTVLGLAVGALFFFGVGLFTRSIGRILFFALFGGIGFLISKPDIRTGKALLDLIRDFREFKSKPRRYFYVHGEGRKR